MDRKNFDEQATAKPTQLPNRKIKLGPLVDLVDDCWYEKASRSGQWKELIGDHASGELVVIDGEALFQFVLEDASLPIGKLHEVNFQIFHAIHLLETNLLEYKDRFEDLEIVFWKTTKEATIAISESPFTISSRLLAREYLYGHLLKLGFVVHQFQSLQDPKWHQYYAQRTPMFVMTGGGNPLRNSGLTLKAQNTLIQRIHLYTLLSSQVPVALLDRAKYQQSKFLTFVLDAAPQSPDMERFFESVSKITANKSIKNLVGRQSQACSFNVDVHPGFFTGDTNDYTKEMLLEDIASDYPSNLPPELFYVFVYHLALLPFLLADERSQFRQELPWKLEELLLEAFLPRIFFAFSTLPYTSLAEIDGNIFRCLLGIVISDPQHTLCAGGDIPESEPMGAVLSSIRSSLKLDFTAFAATFPLLGPSCPDFTSNLVFSEAPSVPSQFSTTMDLEDFNEEDAVRAIPEHTIRLGFDVLDPPEFDGLIKSVDDYWYRPVSRRGRWMDLIGDYAGREPFIIDGEALFQIILDDPLLSVGKPHEANFQILHAIYLLETILLEYKNRFANVEIVFWDATKEVTLAGRSPFAISSRLLARKYLCAHLQKLEFTVHQFESLDDPAWHQYYAQRKPMFVMTNDGGLLPKGSDKLAAQNALIQRTHVYGLLSSKIPVALLAGTEYRDSKILTFILDSAPLSKQIDKIFKSVARFTSTLRHEIICQSKIFSLVPGGDVPQRTTTPSLELLLDGIAAHYPSSLPPELFYVFVHHLMLLPFLSVRERAQPYMKLHQKLEELLTEGFLPRVLFAFSTLLDASLVEIDGNIFRCLLRLVLSDPHHAICTGDDILKSKPMGTFLSNFRRKFKLSFIAFAKEFPIPRQSQQVSAPRQNSHELLPFNNRLINTDLLDVMLPTGSQKTDVELSMVLPRLSSGTTFLDNQHWDGNQKIFLGGRSFRPVDELHRRRLLRWTQRFMSNLQSQAATLTGASGNGLQQIVIPMTGTLLRGPTRPSKGLGNPSQNTYRGKPKGLSSADKRRLEIANEKATREKAEFEQWWQEKLRTLAKSSTPAQMSLMDAALQTKRSQEPNIGTEMRLYRLHLDLQSWIEHDDRDSDLVRDHYTVSIMRKLKELLVDKQWSITNAARKALASVIQSLGFDKTLSELLYTSDESPSRLRFKFVKLVSSKTDEPYHSFMRIKESPVIWQLRLFGTYMDRSMDSAPDPRVSFHPDAWQREVLDCIDKNMSLLVVAPTSAGKTFISYYAMEKVLRSSDDGILVYVAPTKALVTQITAEIYARFNKSVNGKSCWALYTRDYKINDPQNCQILVTVPEILSLLLLFPPLAKVWTPRLKRIILDEIHGIGQHEGGAVWEQILLLAPCPIIGLSATIGSPEMFNDWLCSVQKCHKFDHQFIQWGHRYSHLRKFFYDLHTKPTEPFKDLESHQPSERMQFLHPVSLMSFGARALPPDLSLEPRDLVTLYEALRAEESLSPYCEDIDPVQFFSSKKGLLRQKDILEYEAKLKGLLTRFVGGGFSPEQAESFRGIIHSLEHPDLASKSTYLPSKEDFKKNLIHLLADLNTAKELPAIIFNFDRTECEIIGQAIVDSLIRAEEEYRQNSKSWQEKIKEWEKWKALSKERERQAERLKKQKKSQDEPEGTPSVSWQSTFDPNEPSNEFSFAGIRCGYSKEELNWELAGLERWKVVPGWALAALKRGVAVHHAGMSKAYQSLVEALFRRGFVRVIIATQTLALGINAPAKTCIFAGDSPYLTALMYRQCSGRAGRRGYDLLGNVIFYGITYDRVRRLALSQLPVLGGSFPVTSTLTMRLLNLLEGSDYSPLAQEAVKTILTMPQVGFRSQMGRQQVSHHVRLSIELLRRSRLIDEEGRPINLFAIATHLHFAEPSNFLLVTLLQQGVLHAICAKGASENAQREFILVMAHLFGRRYLPKVLTDEDYRKRISDVYPSMILLPPLPESAQKILKAYNHLVLQTSQGYMVSYARHEADQLGVDDHLPLSGLSYGGQSNEGFAPLRSVLDSTALNFAARSPFVANSGHGDTFSSVDELARTLRTGLYLHEHAIPYLNFSNSSRANSDKGTEHPSDYLNAYLLDFFIHGKVGTLSIANGIRRGDVWYLLQDFSITLKTVKAALEQLLKLALKADDTSREEDPSENQVEEEEDDDDDDDVGDEDDDSDPGMLPRPKGVTEADWRVYEVVSAATTEFETKFRAMWA